MAALHDLHCHLNFMENAEAIASRARTDDMLLFCNTVTPAEWRIARQRFAGHPNVAVGFGAHPWWAAECREAADVLQSDEPWFIGEVGLDLGKRHASSFDLQLPVFTSIASWCAERGNRVLSIHSVGAAAQTLDVLEKTGALESCTCIFHWYTGPSDQLKRAIDAGCLFSVGPRMVATRKGREYIKAIPAKQLLLETDDPPQENRPYPFDELLGHLQAAADAIVAAKGEGALDETDRTSRRLLG